MTASAEYLRRVLRYGDPVQPPAAMAYRPLRVHEGRIPGWLPEPYGPDPVVFGPQRNVDLADSGGLITSHCKEHDVEWAGYGVTCWCCTAGMPALKNC